MPQPPPRNSLKMLTQCPKCKAVFRITQNQLRQAYGRVRCGQCSSVFDGTDNRADQSSAAATKTQNDSRYKEHITAHQTRQQEQEYGVDHIPLPNLIAEQVPEEHQAKPSTKGSWQQILLEIPQTSSTTNPNLNSSKHSLATASLFIAITLVLLLLGQFTFFNRNNFNRDFPLRGVINELCEFVGCVTEPMRDTNQIEIINRNVSAHPSIPEALMIEAKFANIAPFPQPYPILQISLTNLQGKVIAARRFSPRDYLSVTQTSKKLMPPGQPINASIEVLDPGNGAVAFEFQFY